MARFGHAAKGAVYLLVAVLAVRAAVGMGGPPGARGAIRRLSGDTLGLMLQVLIGVGLAIYAVWRIVLGTADLEGRGHTRTGLIRRFTFVLGGLLNLSACVYAFSLVVSSSGNTLSQQELSAWLMSYPPGQWFVGLVGAGFVVFAVYEGYKAATAGFMGLHRTEGMRALELRPFRTLGRVGLAARAVAFGLIGVFFVQAALQHDSSEAGGLGQALQTLARQPHGRWLLGVVGVGLACYGLYCFGVVRYRQFDFGEDA